ncbi:hypothetical protein HBB04_03846 [Pseudomonas coronafaciens]|nr:hypothetical protein HBB04_03846 [Pseudomonas coronafaciens]
MYQEMSYLLPTNFCKFAGQWIVIGGHRQDKRLTSSVKADFYRALTESGPVRKLGSSRAHIFQTATAWRRKVGL